MRDPYPIKVLAAPGKTVPITSLPDEEQAQIEKQMRLVSEVADIDFPEDDEWML